MFWYRADSLQVKRNLRSSITNFEYKLSYELRIDLTLTVLRNYQSLGKHAVYGYNIVELCNVSM